LACVSSTEITEVRHDHSLTVAAQKTAID
jgi:hypothetical protein